MNLGRSRTCTVRHGVARLLAAGGMVMVWVFMSILSAFATDMPSMMPLLIVADGVPAPLVATAGDAQRGRTLLIARDAANCVLCHAVPDPAMRISGNVGPTLAGIGARLSPAQLRLRVADNFRVNPASVMPSYYRVNGLDRVAAPYAGQPILTAAQVEDVVAYLATLQ